MLEENNYVTLQNMRTYINIYIYTYIRVFSSSTRHYMLRLRS